MENTLSLLFLNTAASVINFYGNSHCVQQKKKQKGRPNREPSTSAGPPPEESFFACRRETVAETTRRSLLEKESAPMLLVLAVNPSWPWWERESVENSQQQEKRFPRRSWESAAVLERARAKASSLSVFIACSCFGGWHSRTCLEDPYHTYRRCCCCCTVEVAGGWAETQVLFAYLSLTFLIQLFTC